jgi:hypothetical protein
MAKPYYKGGSFKQKQVVNVTPGGTIESGDKFRITAEDETGRQVTVEYIATATTVANVTAGLAAAWNTSTDPICDAVVATDMTTFVKLEAAEAGVPFYVVSVTTVETDNSPADAQTLAVAEATPNKGPEDWNTPENWSLNALPVNADDVLIDPRAANSILFGLNQVARTRYGSAVGALTLATLTIVQGSLQVGTAYAKLRIKVSGKTKINVPVRDGSRPAYASCINVDLSDLNADVEVWGSATQGENGLESVMLTGTGTVGSAANTLKVFGGVVGLGTHTPADAPANWGTSTAAPVEVAGRGAQLVVGAGCGTVAVLNVRNSGNGGSTATIRNAVTTLTAERDTTVVTEGVGQIGTGNVQGKAYLDGTGGVATQLNIEDGAEVDTTRTDRVATIAICKMYGKSSRLKKNLRTTFTNGVDCLRGASAAQIDSTDPERVTFAAAVN